TILAPTDFSDSARNAINYAAELAKQTKAKLILFHAFHIPAVPSDIPFIMPLNEIEKDTLNELIKIKKNILFKHGSELNIECKTKLGFAVDEINEIAKEEKIDLIVMGVRGAGYLSEKLLGSITTTLIRKAKCPVLAINNKVLFKSIKKIVLACDYENIAIKSMDSIKEFIKLFDSKLYILNVSNEGELISPIKKTVAGTQLVNSFEGLTHSFDFVENEDIVEGINEFVYEYNADLIIMIPRKHTFFENIFQERNTKRMAFHTHIPLLALPE
ncbi:MAG: universal stress protein, partial [Bacteroidetes bacterium]|nr:universal stress protein [Bacteroidota bacterium]